MQINPVQPQIAARSSRFQIQILHTFLTHGTYLTTPQVSMQVWYINFYKKIIKSLHFVLVSEVCCKGPVSREFLLPIALGLMRKRQTSHFLNTSHSPQFSFIHMPLILLDWKINQGDNLHTEGQLDNRKGFDQANSTTRE